MELIVFITNLIIHPRWLQTVEEAVNLCSRACYWSWHAQRIPGSSRRWPWAPWIPPLRVHEDSHQSKLDYYKKYIYMEYVWSKFIYYKCIFSLKKLFLSAAVPLDNSCDLIYSTILIQFLHSLSSKQWKFIRVTWLMCFCLPAWNFFRYIYLLFLINPKCNNKYIHVLSRYLVYLPNLLYLILELWPHVCC